MQISQRQKEDIVILDIEGEIDSYNALQFKNTIQTLLELQKYNVIINLEKVFYIDSFGIGALISGLSHLKKYEGGLKIINVFGPIKKVFESVKLTSFFEFYDSEAEAISNF